MPDISDLTRREWEVVLSCADCGITDQDNQREAIEAVTKFAALVEYITGADGDLDV